MRGNANERAARLVIAHGPELEELWQAMSHLGFCNEAWPEAIEKPKYMFSDKTGLRAEFKFNLSRARWQIALIWEP